MPWTLYRYILRELIRVLILSTSVLCVVIGFAAAIKPLSDGLLGPWSLVKFVGYLLPTMLGFALPFAAAFSSTLVMSRLVNDNEILACRASGMSYAALLLPIFALGLVLTCGLFFLSNWVVPNFYFLADREIERDIMRVMVSQVSKRQPVRFSDNKMVLYADAADDAQPPPVIEGAAEQPYKMILMRGVVVSRLDHKSGALRQEGTAEAARVLLFHRGDQTWSTMQLQNVSVYNADRGDMMWAQSWEVPGMQMPNLFKDKLQFLSWPQLRELGRAPENFDIIRARKRRVAEVMATQMLLRRLEEGLATAAPLKASEPKSRAPAAGGVTLASIVGGQRYVIRAPHVERSGSTIKLAAQGKRPVIVEQVTGTVVARRVYAQSGSLSVELEEDDAEPTVRIDLQRAEVEDTLGSGRGAPRSAMTLPRGRWPVDLLGPLMAKPIHALVEQANQPDVQSTTTVKAVGELLLQIGRLGRRINARLHERASSALGCMMVLLLGATLSMLMRGSTPLVVYFWAFLTATVAVVIVRRSGENIATEGARHIAAGLTVIWLGNILAGFVTLVVYWRLSRN